MNQMTYTHIIMNGAHIDRNPLAAVDLNLMVAFDALAQERSVTRAAQRVGVTQSAMSHALRRLRELFDDALLVRGRSGMALTPRAEALVMPLRSGLTTLGRALTQPARFEPATSRRAFRLATPDLFDVLVIPPLLERIRDIAPGVDIAVLPANPRTQDGRLETGELDLAIVPRMEPTGSEQSEPSAAGLVRRRLFRDRFICIMRAGHPAARRPLSLKPYAALSHALVSPSGEGRGMIDELLAQRGLERRIALRVPAFYSALAIVAKSDLILTAPAGLAEVAPAEFRIVTRELPLRMPRHSINLVWHERFSQDPGHEWLRGLLTEVARAAPGVDLSK
jgi:DNA-binding transcriptional LysR family regulator